MPLDGLHPEKGDMVNQKQIGLHTDNVCYDAMLKEKGLTWVEAQHAAEDRSQWRQIVDALCTTGNKVSK